MLFHQLLDFDAAVCRRQKLFCQQPFQTRVVEHGIRQKALQLASFIDQWLLEDWTCTGFVPVC